MTGPNGLILKFFPIFLLISATVAEKHPIRLKQRPILIFHGFGSSCQAKWYQTRVEQLNATCVETGPSMASFGSYNQMAEAGCNNFKALYRENQAAFRNGVYTFAASNGGIIIRKMLTMCPIFKKLVRRMIFLGTPNLGTYVDSIPLKHQIRSILHHKKLTLMYAYQNIKGAYAHDAETIKEIDYRADNKFIKMLAGDETKLGPSHFDNLELWINVASVEDWVVPYQSTLFGANYFVENGTLTSFPTSEAFHRRYINLNKLYNEGKYMNCVVEGPHAEMLLENERDALYAYLKDDCLFDPDVFSSKIDSELYKICLKMKIMHNKNMNKLRCDPTATKMYHHLDSMSRVKGYTVKIWQKKQKRRNLRI